MNATKRIAKSIKTGLYFDGVTFQEKDPSKAMELRPGTTLSDIELVWGKGVEIAEHSDVFVSGEIPVAQQIAIAEPFAKRPSVQAYLSQLRQPEARPFYCTYSEFSGHVLSVQTAYGLFTLTLPYTATRESAVNRRLSLRRIR